ncbi:MAG TPA: hypothetical protein VI957_02820 [Candidatus Paceibacterota bacterium]
MLFSTRPYVFALIAVFILVAVFGLPFTFTNSIHMEGCPFMAGMTALCTAPLTHIAHWQTAFAAVVIELLLAASLLLVAVLYIHIRPPPYVLAPVFQLHRILSARPLQEAFSNGILNPKIF